MDHAWPLMNDSVTSEDVEALIAFLRTHPRLTQGDQVAAFEGEWSAWLGVGHSVFVNSGASANLVTMAAFRELHGGGEVIVSPLGWISDVVAVLKAGFTPVFADIDLRTLSMGESPVLQQLTPDTRAVLFTHVQGFDGLTDRLLDELRDRDVRLIEDVCESHGATHGDRKCGTLGLASNFSYYFAHHMTTVEGGMVCTDDRELAESVRILRSHGMVREATDPSLRQRYADENPSLHPEFIFAWPGYNVRNTELGAVLGRSQLRRLDTTNAARRRRFQLFVEQLDPDRYFTDFTLAGSCNYAFNLVTRHPDGALFGRAMDCLRELGVEFRRGSAGGGNQLRQPYLRGVIPDGAWTRLPNVEHVHFHGLYFGNHDGVDEDRLLDLCERLNRV